MNGLVSVDKSNVVIETVKRAEDGNGVIVRLYENQRKRGPVTLTAGFDLQAVWSTNLIEDDQAAVAHNGRSVKLNLHPYEIVTLRLT
jgi:alpha-mannosidase